MILLKKYYSNLTVVLSTSRHESTVTEAWCRQEGGKQTGRDRGTNGARSSTWGDCAGRDYPPFPKTSKPSQLPSSSTLSSRWGARRDHTCTNAKDRQPCDCSINILSVFKATSIIIVLVVVLIIVLFCLFLSCFSRFLSSHLCTSFRQTFPDCI